MLPESEYQLTNKCQSLIILKQLQLSETLVYETHIKRNWLECNIELGNTGYSCILFFSGTVTRMRNVANIAIYDV